MRKSKSYKAVEMAPPKTHLKQSHRQMETPKLDKPMKYERSRKGSRS
jgi:hypothetical protein